MLSINYHAMSCKFHAVIHGVLAHSYYACFRTATQIIDCIWSSKYLPTTKFHPIANTIYNIYLDLTNLDHRIYKIYLIVR